MDKFTVDLDQVLNDFEYSELTDQYNSAPKVPVSNVTAVQNQNVTKHSINNVFHSLNEYVNTSISSIEPVDNNSYDCAGDFSNVKNVGSINELKTDSNSIFQIDEINTTQSKKDELNKNNSQENLNKCTEDTLQGDDNVLLDCVNKEDNPASSKNEERIFEFDINITQNENDGLNKNNSQENPNKSIETVLNIDDNLFFDCENKDDNPASPVTEIIVDTSVFEAGDILKYENVENHVDLHTELQNVVGNNFGVSYEQNVTKPLTESKELKTVIGFEKKLHLDDQEISRLLLELEEDDDLNDQNIEESQAGAVLDNVGCDTFGMDDVQILDCKGVCTVNTVSSKNFNEILDVSSENYEQKCGDHIPTENCLSNEISKPSQMDTETLLDMEDSTHGLNPSLKESHDAQKDHSYEDLKNEIESSKDLNMENKNNAVPDVEIHETADEYVTQCNSVEICDEKSVENISNMGAELNQSMNISKPFESIESTEKLTESPGEGSNTDLDDCLKNKKLPAEKCETDSVESCEMFKNDSIECVVTKEKLPSVELVQEEHAGINMEKEESTESVSRPDNLPLVTDNTDNRKINLIGDPGSTPYNNLYVNNEIGKQDQTSDLESSSSSTSPTFSDASSTASTASTEDIQDKQDLHDPIDTNNVAPTSSNFGEAPESSMSIGDGNSLEPNFEEASDVPVDVTEPVSELEPRHVTEEQPSNSTGRCWLGKEPPLWIPDSEAMSCLHCDMKFTMLKRRHHCRACGLVLCSKCCHLRFRLEYLDAEARVCNRCHDILNKESSSGSSSDISPEGGNSPNHRPNPNNPAEYCSTISPLQQMSSSHHSPPAVMVPVGVLKRQGSNKAKSSKSVMFCDGIRPGSDLTNLDNDFNYNNTITKKLEKNKSSAGKINRNLPLIDSETNTFIPKSENSLPPTVTINKSDIKYTECPNNPATVNTLRNTQLTFAIHLSLYVHVKIINMDCCINKIAWCFSTEGLINVGQDEIIILLEYIDDESTVPKDIFYHITTIYNDAVKGNSIKELGLSLQNSSNFLDSKNHAGFLYIRPSFQCMENVIKPKDPFLIGILIHRWETPWAKLFPLRLVLRLGAEYRYYPSPIISTRHRDSMYVEIGHTIINILADFRNFSYSLPQIRGLTIHMEEKITTVNIPVNRYDQVIKSLNNSSDHILAFAGNFSSQADSHLVCIQDTQGNENSYSTHAINIHNKPRKITGASFIVFNGALKTSSGLTAKSNIIEDGFMIQVLPEHLKQIRDNLRAMKNHTISCGCVDDVCDETVQIVWTENDTNFNIGVLSSIDSMPLSGVPSIRVHNGKNYICHNGSRIIRWTEVFIIQNGDDNPKNQDPVDISRVSESIAKATCDALVKYLDLLVANNFLKLGIRVTLHVDNVSYSAGSNNTKLPPIYMKSLDNELIPVLHRITSNNFGENSIVLELIFRILNM